jgi:hypothetical protein
MRHPYLTFYAGCLLCVGALVLYIYVLRGTLWAIPDAIVMVGALVIMTAAHTQTMYGKAEAGKVAKVAAYTIAYNIIGWSLLWLGDYLLRAMR